MVLLLYITCFATAFFYLLFQCVTAFQPAENLCINHSQPLMFETSGIVVVEIDRHNFSYVVNFCHSDSWNLGLVDPKLRGQVFSGSSLLAAGVYSAEIGREAARQVAHGR